MVQLPQLILHLFERLLLLLGKALPGTVDIEVEHRHRRPERFGLAAPASFGRPLQRFGDPARAVLFEDAPVEIERVARFRDVLRPALGCLARLPTNATPFELHFSRAQTLPFSFASSCFRISAIF